MRRKKKVEKSWKGKETGKKWKEREKNGGQIFKNQ